MSKFAKRGLVVVVLFAAAMTAGRSFAAGQDLKDASDSYVLGPEDQITIRALDAEEINEKVYRIGSDGGLTVPTIGRVNASGLTAAQLESELVHKLGKYIRQPKVAVTVTEFHSQPVSVIGAV